jgi:hypothetical protein
MKALMRPGAGDSGPSDGHQVCLIGWCNSMSG